MYFKRIGWFDFEQHGTHDYFPLRSLDDIREIEAQKAEVKRLQSMIDSYQSQYR